MGLARAVGIAEHIHRTITTAQLDSGLRLFPLDRQKEVRRDMPLPLPELSPLESGELRDHALVIYIDDFAEHEDLDFRDMAKLQGTAPP